MEGAPHWTRKQAEVEDDLGLEFQLTDESLSYYGSIYMYTIIIIIFIKHVTTRYVHVIIMKAVTLYGFQSIGIANAQW